MRAPYLKYALEHVENWLCNCQLPTIHMQFVPGDHGQQSKYVYRQWSHNANQQQDIVKH